MRGPARDSRPDSPETLRKPKGAEAGSHSSNTARNLAPLGCRPIRHSRAKGAGEANAQDLSASRLSSRDANSLFQMVTVATGIFGTVFARGLTLAPGIAGKPSNILATAVRSCCSLASLSESIVSVARPPTRDTFARCPPDRRTRCVVRVAQARDAIAEQCVVLSRSGRLNLSLRTQARLMQRNHGGVRVLNRASGLSKRVIDTSPAPPGAPSVLLMALNHASPQGA